MVKGKVFRGTWKGRPGKSTTWKVGQGVMVNEHQWADESLVTVWVQSGDAMRGTYGEYLRVEGVEPGSGQALADALVVTR